MAKSLIDWGLYGRLSNDLYRSLIADCIEMANEKEIDVSDIEFDPDGRYSIAELIETYKAFRNRIFPTWEDDAHAAIARS